MGREKTFSRFPRYLLPIVYAYGLQLLLLIHPPWLISLYAMLAQDEIYHNITYGERDASALEFDTESSVLVINSFSKYCMWLPSIPCI